MIQIQSREQFTKAAERARKERMSVRRYERGAYEVTNPAHKSRYIVRFERRDGSVFGTCTCEAGTPSRERRPMVCKHLYVATIMHNAIAAMRRRAA